MTVDQTQYLVLHDDETRLRTSGPAMSPIPTFGAATSVVDQYRTVGIHSTNLPELGAAFTDVAAASAIAKIAEGGIADHLEIEAAETALQALLLHEIVHVITHAPKVDYGNGFISNTRFDRGARSEFSYELFQVANSRDWIIAPEFIRAEDRQIVESTLEDSPLVGRSLDDLQDDLNRPKYWSTAIGDAINVVIEEHGIPGYLTDPDLVYMRRGDGFHKRFYHRMRVSWDKAVGDLPPVVCTFTVPPLLAIVLDRLNNRADLRDVIIELREELAPVRAELIRLNDVVTRSTTQPEIEGIVRRIDQAFDAIVPESRLSRVQRFRRTLGVVHRLVRPIVRHMASLIINTGIPYDDIVQIAGNIESLVLESSAIVDRTTTSKVFAGLLKTEALQSLVDHHFTSSEISAIERSIRRQR